MKDEKIYDPVLEEQGIKSYCLSEGHTNN